jgi:hypothetical protein
VKYAIPKETWAHYRKKGLGPIGAFRVLRQFEDPVQFQVTRLCVTANSQRAYKHLVDMKLVPRSKTAAEIWGEGIWLINHKMSRYGIKFSLLPQTPEAVDLWCSAKRQQVLSILGK